MRQCTDTSGVFVALNATFGVVPDAGYLPEVLGSIDQHSLKAPQRTPE
jgi:hypothetical protein